MHETIVFVVRVRCRRKESSRSLSHLLMSFLSTFAITETVVYVGLQLELARQLFPN